MGCAFLTSSPDDSFVIIQQRTGDLLVVAAATAWAAYIVLTAAIPPDAGALEVQARKNLACAGFYGMCWASSASVEASGAWTPLALLVVAYCALVPGALADVFQQRAQAAIHAAEASIVLSSEPIWAALLAAPVLGEGLTARVGGGGALIFAGAALAASGSSPGDEAAAFLDAAFAAGVDVQV